MYGVFRDLYEEHGHELTLPTWSAAIGTLCGSTVVELGRLRGLPFDVDEVRARTEERVREAAERVPLRPGVAGFLRQLDEADTAGAREQRPERVAGHASRTPRLADGWAAMVCADGDASRAKPKPPPLPGRARAARRPGRLDVAIKDSPNGVRAAKAAGILGVCVPNNEATAGLSDPSQADLLVPNVEGLAVDDVCGTHGDAGGFGGPRRGRLARMQERLPRR